MNRVIRACRAGVDNPIVSIHDQGAGGNGNVLKEICEPLGATLQVREIASGDATLSVLELWGAEYQENCGLLIKPESLELFKQICARENCPVSFVGQVANDGRVVLTDKRDGSTPVDLPLSLVLADMPKKTFKSATVRPQLAKLSVPAGTTVAQALDRVLRLPSVGSERFLTNKVDRSVTGLIAQQQCVGPLHTPLADVGVIAHTHADVAGAATAVGEQPIKGLLSPAAMARLTVAEAVSNLVFAAVTDLGDVKCSANWMWAAKLEGEAAAMYEACEAMVGVMAPLGVAVDGGKDSHSMAAKAGGETVKAPGELVVTVYAACPDVRLTVTPDLKGSSGRGGTKLYLVDVSGGRRRLGGSALAQCYNQIGDVPSDLDDAPLLRRAFVATQALVKKKGTLLAGHDVSDGGLLTCVLEMAFAATAASTSPSLPRRRRRRRRPRRPRGGLRRGGRLGARGRGGRRGGGGAARDDEGAQRAVHAARRHHRRQARQGGDRRRERGRRAAGGAARRVGGDLVRAREAPVRAGVCRAGEGPPRRRTTPQWTLSYAPAATPAAILKAPSGSSASPSSARRLQRRPRDGGRALRAGLAPWDVAMSDLVAGRLTLDRFRGVIFVGVTRTRSARPRGGRACSSSTRPSGRSWASARARTPSRSASATAAS